MSSSIFIRFINGKIEARLREEISEDEDISSFIEETVKIQHAGWDLTKYIESISVSYNPMGMRLSSNETLISHCVRYLLKDASFLDLEFELDSEGYERIREDVWNEFTIKDSIDPALFLAIYRSSLRVNNI